MILVCCLRYRMQLQITTNNNLQFTTVYQKLIRDNSRHSWTYENYDCMACTYSYKMFINHFFCLPLQITVKEVHNTTSTFTCKVTIHLRFSRTVPIFNMSRKKITELLGCPFVPFLFWCAGFVQTLSNCNIPPYDYQYLPAHLQPYAYALVAKNQLTFYLHIRKITGSSGSVTDPAGGAHNAPLAFASYDFCLRHSSWIAWYITLPPSQSKSKSKSLASKSKCKSFESKSKYISCK